jgi:hypothetical protein
MRQEDEDRFREVMATTIEAETQEHLRLLTSAMLPSDSMAYAFQEIQTAVDGCKIQEYFVDPLYFEHRVFMLIDWAANCVSKWYRTLTRSGKDIGWCPLSHLVHSEYYPFNLNQIVRTSIVQDWASSTKLNKSALLKTNSVATLEWYRLLLPESVDPNSELIVIAMGPYCTNHESVPLSATPFVPEILQNYVYHPDVNQSKNPIALIHFESICGRVVNKLIQLYLDTVFRQLFSPYGSGGKQEMWKLVEIHALSFLTNKS